MKLAGFALLLSGWIIIVSALAMLAEQRERAFFIVAGVLVEMLGLGLALRSHRMPAGGSE